MSALNKYVTTRNNPPVTTRANDRQVVNNTGGFVYEVSDQQRLERFLILGTDGGTYYVNEPEITAQNVSFLEKLIQRSPQLVLDVVLDVSTTGRAYRNGPAIFVLALMLNSAPDSFKSQVVNAVPKVARTATMVYDLANFIDKLGGWGRSKRRAISGWFSAQSPENLAYQAVKYRQRNGWTLRDLMRLSHPVGLDQNVGNFILGHAPLMVGEVPSVIDGFITMQASRNTGHVLKALEQYPKLPWETIPTQFLRDPEVWKVLFYNGSLQGQALVRNVIRLSRIDAFGDVKFAGDYAKKLKDVEMIRKTRLHPVQYLLAGITYDRGQNDRVNGGRRKDWTTNAKIKSALDEGFYSSFSNVEPTGKRLRIGVDVSGSMSWSSSVGADITAAEGAAAMAMVLARSEDYVEILGFSNTLKDLHIGSNDSMSEVLRKTRDNNFGWTNPSLLIDKANYEIDGFIVITDNEVNHGNHASLSMRNYRQKTGLDSKLIVMGMTATNFSIADPSDPGMLDVVGFDANVPKVVTDFMKGKI
jgi:60 kDa SS-A/Ro ribonucleoprotein